MSKKRQIILLVSLWLVLFAVTYMRPLSFGELMADFSAAPITACEGKFCTLAAEEDGSIVYRDVTKRFAVGGAEYAELLALLEEESYRQQLMAAFSGGHRPHETEPYPRAELTFTQGETVYEISIYADYLALGQSGAVRDVEPEGKAAFCAGLMAFVAEHGEEVSVETRDYAKKG